MFASLRLRVALVLTAVASAAAAQYPERPIPSSPEA